MQSPRLSNARRTRYIVAIRPVAPHRIGSTRRRLAFLLIPVAALMGAMLMGYSASARQWTQAQRALAHSNDASVAALRLKFLGADLNGWQTAYAFDFMLSGSGDVAALHGRQQFLDSAEKFTRRINEAQHFVETPEEDRTLVQLAETYSDFIDTDRKIVAAYQSGDRDRIAVANQQVIGIEIERFEAMSRLTDRMVKLRQSRVQQDLFEHAQTMAWIHNLLWGAGVFGFIFSVALSALLLKSMAKSDCLVTELGRQALTDSLTDLPNRRAWETQLSAEVARAIRLGYPLAAVLIDIDNFKRFNDERGHAQGDQLLQKSARGWTELLRQGDFIARVGGEEFALLLPGCSAESARNLVERLRPGMALGQTFSAGIAALLSTETPEQLYARADAAMYRAKRNGRNQTMIAADPQSSSDGVDPAG